MAKNKISRGKGSGTVYKNGNRWVGALVVGKKPDGKPDRKYVYGKTRTEAEQELDKFRQRLHLGLVVERGSWTVAEHIDEWYAIYAAEGGGRARSNTIKRREVHVRLHIKPYLGHLPLDKVTPYHVEKWIEALVGKGLAGSSIGSCLSTLSLALKRGVVWRRIPYNPADDISAPEHEPKLLNVLDNDGAKRLLQVSAGSRWHAVIHLGLATGLRPGELLALTWQHVRLDTEPQVTVAHTLEDGSLRLGPPKTRASHRSVPLDRHTVQVLRRQRAAQAAMQLAAGGDWNPLGLVFSRPTGTPLTRNMFWYGLKDITTAHDLPHLRPHDLRHTYATLLLEQGVNAKVVSERLGHRSVAFTMQTYGHVLPSMQREATERYGAMLFGEGDI